MRVVAGWRGGGAGVVAVGWVGGGEQAGHLRRAGEGSVAALPIVGEFRKKVYDDGRLGVSRTDRFVRPPQVPHYDCDEEAEPSERTSEPGIAEDDDFFD